MWKISFSDFSIKQMKKMDNASRERINEFLKNRVKNNPNPKLLAKSLSGNLSGLWRFRVGDWRLICEIRDNELIIIVTEIGHRKEIYRPYR